MSVGHYCGRWMRGLSERRRQENPVAAVVEDNGGIRPYKNREYCREHYWNVPLRYRRKNGLPPDIMFMQVRSEVGFVDSIDEMIAWLRNPIRKRKSEDDWYAHKAEEAALEIAEEVVDDTVPF